MKPHPNNFCGGNFSGWLEVMLWDKCNGKCEWCVEKDGYHPDKHIPCEELAYKIIHTQKNSIILLGGEPTLYPQLKQLICLLATADKSVFVTTNGSRLTTAFVKDLLLPLSGINISIHNFDLQKSCDITGILHNKENLRDALSLFENTRIRLNCNLIRGHIDSLSMVHKYIAFAKDIGANGIRFAELKGDSQKWVDMHEIFGNEYGVNNDPFGLGCIRDVVINEMPVNLRQMCGLQTEMRKKPVQPEQIGKQVMYYDGQIYYGWQKRGLEMTKEERKKILEAVKSGEMTIEEAEKKLKKDRKVKKIYESSGGSCGY